MSASPGQYWIRGGCDFIETVWRKTAKTSKIDSTPAANGANVCTRFNQINEVNMMHNNLTQETIRQIKATYITPTHVASHMLEILESNERIPAKRPLTLRGKRTEALNWLSKHVFNSNLALWAEYIDLIASNDYLMCSIVCEGIDWILEPENCRMILAGNYPGGSGAGTNDAVTDPTPTDNQ